MPQKSIASADVVRITLIVGGLIVLALILWQLSHVLLLVFAAILIAAILRAVSNVIHTRARLNRHLSLILACVVIAALIAGFVYLLGLQIARQFETLAEELPSMVQSLGTELGIPDLAETIFTRAGEVMQTGGVFGSILGYTSGAVGLFSSLLLVIVAGLYLAFNPTLYRNGVLKLVPRDQQPSVGDAMDNAGRALRLWLVGQLIAMVFIGVATSIALWAVGMPSFLALGFIAGVLEFVPYVGPILSAIPAIVIALASDDPNLIFWVIGVYLVIQQLENSVLIPLIQRHTVELPPVLGLFALVALGILFGPLGIVLATPMTVVVMVLVKQLYVRETLQEATVLPGEGEHEAAAATAVAQGEAVPLPPNLAPKDALP